MMFERLCEILEEFAEVSKEKMVPESNLLSDLGMNSIDMVEAVVAIEEEFAIKVPDKIISSLQTIEDVVIFLKRCN